MESSLTRGMKSEVEMILQNNEDERLLAFNDEKRKTFIDMVTKSVMHNGYLWETINAVIEQTIDELLIEI